MIKENLNIGDKVKFFLHRHGCSGLYEGIIREYNGVWKYLNRNEYHWFIEFKNRNNGVGIYTHTGEKEAYKLQDNSYYIRVENY